MKYGTAERAAMVAAVTTELGTWTVKDLYGTLRAQGFSCGKLDKKGLVEKLALAFVNKALPGHRVQPMSAEALANS